jgi:RES domain-containing protein
MESMADRVRAFRLVKAQYAPGLDGEGAKKSPGRWNVAGTPMVYCASSASLAVLETFVHLPPAMRRADKFPPLVLVTLDVVATGMTELSVTDPYDLAQTRRAGTDWLTSMSGVGAWVPSQVVPADRNLLLNPRHPDFGSCVTVVEMAPFTYDPRMAT